MDFFLLIVLGLPVLWLIIRERRHDQDRGLIQKLTNRVFLLEEQLRALKDSPRVAAEPPATPAQLHDEYSSERGQAPPQSIPESFQPAAFTVDNPVFLQSETTTYASPAAGNSSGSSILDHSPASVQNETSTDRESWVDSPPSVTSPQPELSIPIAPSPSLEERLGANWLNKLGIVILVIGLSLFLAYQLRTLGPLGKTIVGFVLSIALLAGGLVLERQSRYRIFARAAIGGGWALTFFVMYAMYHVAATRVLSSQLLDLILMMLTASGMVWHSLRYRSQVVTALAFLLAFATVGISHVTLFSLVAGALLAAGLVYVSSRRYWYELGAAGLVAVYGNHFLWLSRVLPDGGRPGKVFPEFLPSALLLLFYWLLFRIAYLARTPRDRREELIASSTAVLNSVGLMGLLKYQSAHPEWGFYAVLTLGIAEFALALYARQRRRPAFVVLSSIASILLLAAIPLRFTGASWPLLWLLEAEALLMVGLRLREAALRRLGILGGIAAAIQLIFAGTLPIIFQQQADRGHHSGTAAALICGALLFWINAEIAPLRWKELLATEADEWSLTVTSYLGLITAASGLWLLFPGSLTIVVWMALALLLGLAADRLKSKNLATQADLLSIVTITRAVFLNLQLTSNWHALPQRAVTVSLVAAGLYLVTRRTTDSYFLKSPYLPAAYSWAGSALLALLLWYQLQPAGVAVGWAVLGLVLFEVSIVRRRTYLRRQGYLLLALSFIRIFVSNLNLDAGTHWLSPRLYTVLPLLAGYYWVYERLRTAELPPSTLDRIMGGAAAWATTVGLVALAYFEVTHEWVVVAWAALVLVLVSSGWRMKRTIFTEQAIALLLVTGGRAILFNLFSSPPLSNSFWNARLFSVTAACALLLLCLPVAFRLRSNSADPFPPENAAGWIRLLLARPEQPLFFVPLVVFTTLLAVQLRSGVITMAWSALGVLVFLVALAVKERSYRLAGLGLLLLCVGKIIFVDIWSAAPADRYITLIVMGVALLLVSFLYSRYRETVLRFL